MSRPGLGGAATVVSGSEFTKTATIGERTAQANLNLAREKFAFEKDNPGLELKEDETGNLFAINKRTLQVTPVMMGGGASPPAVAPMAGQGGPRIPTPAQPAMQQIPGMTSVLDIAATPLAAPVAQPPAAKQFVGKTSGLSEGERKATTLLQRLQFSQGQLTKALLNDPDAAKPGLFTSALDILSTSAANALKPEARQRVESAQLDILDAALTLGTGAAYTKDQLEGYRKSYFPQIGDEPATVRDKKARLDNVISAARISAGKGASLVSGTLPGANPNDPLGLGVK
jgi:hypothetical protein